MKWLKSERFRQLIAAGLILSLWPSFCLPLLKTPGRHGGVWHVEWLKAQLRYQTNDAIERAIEEALGRDAHNLRLFLEAFVDAYLQQQGVDDEQVFADAVLHALLRNHWLQLIGEAVVSNLSFKSVQVRTTSTKERKTAYLFVLFKGAAADEALYASRSPRVLSSPLFVLAPLGASLQPRAP